MTQITTTRREILAAYKIRKEWEQLFNCNRNTILRALRFQSNSDLAVRIRKYATEQGYGVKNIPTIVEC